VRRAVQRSAVLRQLNETLPPSGSILNALSRIDPFPSFSGPPVDLSPPNSAIARDPEVKAAGPGVVRILGTACGLGVEGSGWVARPGIVVTNAHVVAGTAGQTVVDAREHRQATVVLFDPAADVAVLRVPGLSATPLALAAQTIPRGAGGVIVGFPGGPPVKAVPAAVRQHLDATGRDIYGRGELERSLYELQGEVRPGNSGGPFVLADGAVAGVVFASSTLDHDAAYAIDAETVRPLVQASLGRTQPADTQSCLSDLAE
jgi:S1-C subfamily serine protease